MNTILINSIQKHFIKKFNKTPLTIFSPGRINIIGEHTDYNDGFVFPAAVNKGIMAALSKSSSNTSSVCAVDFNDTIVFSIDDINPMPKESWGNYVLGVIVEIRKLNKIIGEFNMVFGGDIPSGSGMSSSAALENSIVFGLNELFNLGLSKTEMILISQRAEHNYVGVNCGIMDQYASMFGIKNHALLLDCRSVKAKPFKINFDHYEFLLINTNIKHSLSDSAYNDRRLVCENICKMLNIQALRDATEADLNQIKNKLTAENYQKALFVIQENRRVLKSSEAILNNDLEALGKLIYESHEGLKDKYKVSCDELDFLVEKTKNNNLILGSRMMGGGFGGCTINLIAKNEIEPFKISISKAYKDKFNLDCSIYSIKLSDGTHLIK
jgi:galactokinase